MVPPPPHTQHTYSLEAGPTKHPSVSNRKCIQPEVRTGKFATPLMVYTTPQPQTPRTIPHGGRLPWIVDGGITPIPGCYYTRARGHISGPSIQHRHKHDHRSASGVHLRLIDVAWPRGRGRAFFRQKLGSSKAWRISRIFQTPDFPAPGISSDGVLFLMLRGSTCYNPMHQIPVHGPFGYGSSVAMDHPCTESARCDVLMGHRQAWEMKA